MAARPAQGRRIVPQIRGGYVRALESLASKGRPVSTIIEKMIEEDPFKAFDTLARFCPKELLMAAEDEDGNAMPMQINVVFKHADGD